LYKTSNATILYAHTLQQRSRLFIKVYALNAWLLHYRRCWFLR